MTIFLENKEIRIPSDFSLALGGGAARGIAHIAIIRRMEYFGVAPKEIAGTSMGAIIAALYALGYTADQMEAIAQDTNLFKLIDFDLSHGIFEGGKIVELFQKYFGEKTIESLSIPLTIVATDIDTGEALYLREGRVIDAVRASMSIPGIFSPYEYQGRSLVDGGLVENLPIGAIQGKEAVLAISVQMPLSHVWDGKTGNRFFTQGTIFSNTYSILRKTIAIMMLENERRSQESREDVYKFSYNNPDIDYHAFHKADEIIRTASEQIAKEVFFNV